MTIVKWQESCHCDWGQPVYIYRDISHGFEKASQFAVLRDGSDVLTKTFGQMIIAVQSMQESHHCQAFLPPVVDYWPLGSCLRKNGKIKRCMCLCLKSSVVTLIDCSDICWWQWRKLTAAGPVVAAKKPLLWRS